MIASTQITNTEIFAFITVLVCTLLSRKQKRQKKLLKSRLLFKKIGNFTGKLNYCKIIDAAQGGFIAPYV